MPTISGSQNIDITKLTHETMGQGVEAKQSRSGALRDLSFSQKATRLSFSPEASQGIAGLLFAPVRWALQSVGLLSKPVTVPKEAYPARYQEVDFKKGLSYQATIPGYNNLDALKRSVEISGLASSDSLAKLQSGDSPLDKDLSNLGLKRLDETCELWKKLPTNLKDALQADGAIRDTKTGLVALVAVSDNEKDLHVVFGGTGSGLRDVMAKGTMGNRQMEENVKTIGAFHSHVPESYRQAAELVGALKQVALANTLTMDVSGFSKGGGEAAFSGIYHGVKTLSHCGMPLSPACQRMLGPDKIKHAVQNRNIFNTSVSGDFVSGSKLFNGIATTWEKLTGLQVARRIGPGLRITNHDQPKTILGVGSFTTHNNSFKIYEKLSMDSTTRPVNPVTKGTYEGTDAIDVFEDVLGTDKLKEFKKELLTSTNITQCKVTIETDKTNPKMTKSRLVVDLSAVQLDSSFKTQVDDLEKGLSEKWKSNDRAERTVTVLHPAWKKGETS